MLSLLDAAGAGVSAALGVGGRDLSAAVGGRSARAALAALDDDPATELIVVHLQAARRRRSPRTCASMRPGLSTPVQFAFVGLGEPDLTAATEAPRSPRPGQAGPPASAALAGRRRSHAPARRRCAACSRAARSATEAMVIAERAAGPDLLEHPAAAGSGTIGRATPTHGHMMIDFGDDELTVGRAHPMIDQSLRLERLAAEAADPATAVILLDVVLGHGAHPDPASELAPAIAAARERSGSGGRRFADRDAGDPQGLAGRRGELPAAGAHVFARNAQAARFACDWRLGGAVP